jgi:hypothetical protein
VERVAAVLRGSGASGAPIPTQIKQGLARPEGAGRALATYRVPIEGHDEWLAAAGRRSA